MNVVDLLGGLSLVLFGIHLLTEGLKGLAGDGLRRVLQTLVSGRWSGLLTGVTMTAIVQSSGAATLAVIGFVSAGLVTFSQAVAVIFGANLGATTISWLVALFGLKMSLSQAALPVVAVGVFLRLLTKGRRSAAGKMLVGFGLLFLGIGYLQTGLAPGSWDLSRWTGTGPAASWLLGGVGLLMSAVMQSSGAAAAATLVALHAGSVTFPQACAMIIGQGIGTTITAAYTIPSGGTSVRRTALAHILFNLITGCVAMLALGPLSKLAAALASVFDQADGVLALAVFHTGYKLVGIALLFPLLEPFSSLIKLLVPPRGAVAMHGISSTLARLGGPVAVEAGWRAALDLCAEAGGALEHLLAGGQPPSGRVRTENLTRIGAFLNTLRLEANGDDSGPRRRVSMMWRAMDHLERLEKSLAEPLPIHAHGPEEGLAETAAARQALIRWRDEVAALTPHAPFRRESLPELERAAADLAEHRRRQRVRLLEGVAGGSLEPEAAREALARLLWTDQALFHAWRAADSLVACASREESEKKRQPKPAAAEQTVPDGTEEG